MRATLNSASTAITNDVTVHTSKGVEVTRRASPRMGTMIRPFASLAVMLVIGASAVRSQATPRRVTLSTPDAAFAEPFSSVAGLRELQDGRLLVADRIEQRLVLVDITAGTQADLGRRGEGPGEYEMPGALFGLPGDSTLMMDMLNRRFTLIQPDGKLSTATIPLRHPDGFPIFPRGVDRQGRIYFDLAGMMMPGLEETAASGIAPLLRWDPKSGAVDTLGTVSFPPMPGSTGPGEMRISIGGGTPYAGRDEWAVTPDGRVGVARYAPYRVEWLSQGGAPVAGDVVTYTAVPITKDEKDAWADAMTSRGLMVEVENGRRRVRRPPRPDIDRQTWPKEMPPFLSGASRATPEGELWVERAQSARQARRTYDVFDASGRLARQVVLPENRRLIGFGTGVLYAVRVDQDDLEWLERYSR